MNNFLRKVWNYALYMKWTDCRHERTIPSGFYDIRCMDCGVEG